MSRKAFIYVQLLALCLQLLFGSVLPTAVKPASGDGAKQDMKIVARNDWDSGSKSLDLNGVKFSRSPEYIVLSVSNLNCNDQTECKASITNDKMTSNFYIGNNGKIYEGRGWVLVPESNLGGLNEYALSVVVFISPQTSAIPAEVKDALVGIIKNGIELKKISNECKYIDSNLITTNWSEISAKGVELYGSLPENKKLKEDEDINLNPADKYPSAGLFPIVLLEEWHTTRKTPKVEDKGRNITKLIINDQGSRCFSDEECVKNLLQDDKNVTKTCEGKGSNFYIGDTGLAYEGKGWYEEPCYDLKESKSTALVITFMGPYSSYGPSTRSILALKRLIKFGLWLKIIDINYTVSAIDIFTEKKIGKQLSEAIQKLPGYSASVTS